MNLEEIGLICVCLFIVLLGAIFLISTYKTYSRIQEERYVTTKRYVIQILMDCGYRVKEIESDDISKTENGYDITLHLVKRRR